jgi:hypothetical protein
VARLREGEKDPEKRKAIPDLSGLTSYVLRHTYTTHALTSGVPVPVVSALLGHKSMKMVDEHHNHTDRATEVLKDAAAKAAQQGPSSGRKWSVSGGGWGSGHTGLLLPAPGLGIEHLVARPQSAIAVRRQQGGTP